MTKVVAVLALLCVAHTARADDGSSPRSETEATLLAVGGSLVGPALIVTALEEGNDYRGPLHQEFWPMMVAGGITTIFGPSLGNFYAGNVLSAGLGVRLAATAVLGIGASVLAGEVFSVNTIGIGFFGLIGGATVIALGDALDIREASRAAADFNRHHVSIAPMVARTAAGSQTGLQIVGSF
jgi:hypothetical protein